MTLKIKMTIKNTLQHLVCMLLLGIAANAQTQDDILNEAKRQNITTKAQALQILANKGITEAQAREMAQLRGIDFDTFLANHLSNNTKTEQAVLQDTINTATRIEIDSLKENAEQIITKPLTNKDTLTNKYFGYNIFENNPFGQKDYLVGNIDENYILAPGDELRLTIFGDNSLNLITKIDLNGNINLPNMGMFSAAGNTYATLKDRLQTFLGKYVSGLISNPQRTFLDVSLTQIRPVKITVLGNVTTPGPHLVNGLATVLNALYASGGIKTSGTLRDVKVYRDNKLLKTIDLYDFITQGHIETDVRLANNDIIFIGARLSSVHLSGTVKEAKIFELKPQETLADLFRFSGGLPINASVNNINIARITPFNDRTQTQVFDKFITTINASLNKNILSDFKLFDGDAITVNSILNHTLNQVSISGHVNQPGTYALTMYPNLKVLINNAAKQILPNTFMDKVDVYKENLKGEKSFKTYSLQDVLNDAINVPLESNDLVTIYSNEEVLGKETVSVSGFVNTPKTIFWRANLSLFDVIFQSTSLQELEYSTKLLSSRIDLKRFDTETGLYKWQPFSLDNLIQIKNTFLSPKDEVVLYSKQVFENLNPQIEVLGYVNNPGKQPLAKTMYVEDALLAAGGFVEFANKNAIYINRLSTNPKDTKYSQLITYQPDLNYLLGKTQQPKNPFILMPHDVISVIKPKNSGVQKKVVVTGEIMYPQTIILENETVSLNNIIQQAGGLTPQANLNASYILRQDQKLAINLAQVISSSKQVIQPNDVIYIASNTGNVNTLGAVNQENLFGWQQHRRAKYYLRQSGGLKANAGMSYIIQNNGKIEKITLFKNPIVWPGAKIVTETKPEKQTNGNRSFMDDLTRIIGITTGTLTTIILASKL